MGGRQRGTGAVTAAPSSVSDDEVAEAKRLEDLAEEADHFLVLEGEVERGHVIAHLDIRYDSTPLRSVSERAEL